jgi:predicted MPP superfamily phosphohydrolase
MVKSSSRAANRRWSTRRTKFWGIFLWVYALILIYPWVRIDILMGSAWQPGPVTYAIMCAGPLLVRFNRERLPRLVARWLSLLCMTWLGISFILFVFLVLFEPFNLILSPLPQHAAWALLGATALSALIGAINAQLISIKTIELRLPRLREHLRVVQISDVHIGSRLPRLLRRIVKKTNALQPDYVMITGDLIDLPHISVDELHPLSELAAPAYYVIGNHERYVDLDEIDARLRTLGLIVLRNEDAITRHFQVIGIDDAEDTAQVGMQLSQLDLDREALKILLYHRPTGLEAAAEHGIDLMLTGHTHAGQIIPFNLVVRRVFAHVRGLATHGSTTLYVSPGTGTWGPVMRLGSRSEITCFELSGQLHLE